MKQKMWSLINTKTNTIIKIGIIDSEINNEITFVVGFDTKKDLLGYVMDIDHSYEEVRKIEFKI